MKRISLYCLIFSLLILINISGCTGSSTDSDDDGMSKGLVGSWVASYLEVRHALSPELKVNLTDYGVSYSMVVTPDSTYEAVIDFKGSETIETGTLSMHDTLIIYHPVDDEPKTGQIHLQDYSAEVTIEGEEFDFNMDGINEPAQYYVELDKIK